MNYDYQRLNSQPHMFVPTGDLRVAPYDIEQLYEVEIRQKINEHSTLRLKGLLKDARDESVEALAEGTGVALSAVDSFGEEYMLFQGIATDVAIQSAQGTRLIEAKAVSYSYLLDIGERSRSFQDKKKTYAQLIGQVAGAYPGASVADAATDGAPTNKFIMQHKETDWAFLKRLASHFNTGLLCDARLGGPSCSFGVPDSQALQLDSSSYTVRKDIHRFNILSGNGARGIGEDDFISYAVETNCLAMIGDAVEFRGRLLYVSEAIGTADRGFFASRLVLAPKKGLSQPYLANRGAVGASYSGHILDARNDRVRVALDTDAGHDPGEPCWFPYSTVYSSKSGSGWYCMPEKGDSVRVYFPDGDDDNAYAISSVHESVDDADAAQRGAGSARSSGGAGGYSGKRDDPKVKSLTYGSKEVRLTPEGVYIIADNAMISLTEEGLSLTTDNDIELRSEKNIVISAGEDVNIIGTSGVELACAETAAIRINENIEAIGQEVLAN